MRGGEWWLMQMRGEEVDADERGRGRAEEGM